MADKMMRIAGRDHQGNAKALRTDEEGTLQFNSQKEMKLQDNSAAIGNGKYFNVTGYSSIAIQVSGTFDAEIWFRGSVDGVNYVDFFVASDLTTPTSKVTKPGVYLANVTGYKSIHARVNKYTSGNVDVFAKASTITMSYVPMASLTKRNVEITRAVDVTVGIGKTVAVLTYIDVSEYPLNYVKVRADSEHNFKVSFVYQDRVSPPKGPGAESKTVFVSAGRVRGDSEWIEGKGEMLHVYIVNESEVDHNYDVVVCGVR